MNSKLHHNLELVLETIFLIFIFLDSFLLFTSVFLPLRGNSYVSIAYFDLITSALLLLGYWIQQRRTKSKTGYLKRNWNGIIAIIPIYFIGIVILGINESSIIIKVLALIKVLTLIMAARQVGRAVDQFVSKSKLVYGFAFFVVVLLVCSVGFFLLETGVNPEVTTYEDSLWYVIQTITTVGYGDVVPITQWGRLIGVIAMISAIGISSLLTAATTSSLMDKLREDREKLAKSSVDFTKKLDKRVQDMESKMAKEENVKEIEASLNEIKSEINEIKDLLNKINR
ncbi:potassium channel family protein [Methanobacterium formicicum]|uniref:Potassium channel-like protein n=1 Tax=Methanobacterium formicicum (strain DSM 3637 / PP1) TaxID=1204725 RepID=K2QBA5_METFP|nr:potassium channel family protein [Methanobacterium formicicum]EKF85251.1 potassium channel-like protein [Methanobacterium formicicum DSM 3637]